MPHGGIPPGGQVVGHLIDISCILTCLDYEPCRLMYVLYSRLNDHTNFNVKVFTRKYDIVIK